MSSSAPDPAAVAKLVAEARTKPETEWDQFLAEACVGNTGLFREVSAILRPPSVDEEETVFLPESDRKPPSQATAPDNAPTPAPLGEIGDYRIEGEIARGGMGVVYRARQISLDRPVALKMIRESVLASEAEVARFRLEAEAAGNIDHPNLLPVYEIGEEDGHHYFSMKLIEGGTLHNPPVELLPKDPRSIASCIAKVARGLHAAHQNGILHRDIKPGNILLDDDGEPHLVDFGLAKQMDVESGFTLSGEVLGTPAYMSPEQAEGGKLTTASDVYSLGTVLYQLTTGKPPFRGSSLADTLRQVVEEVPERPSQISRRIPRDLETIILKCLDKDPQQRYVSAAGLAADLERWVRGEAITARKHTSLERLGKWAKRKPALAALWALAAALVAILAVGGPLVAFNQSRLNQELRTKSEEISAKSEEISAQSEKIQLQADESLRKLYYAQMVRAAQELYEPLGLAQADRLTKAWSGTEGDGLRGWEWRFLSGQKPPKPRVLANIHLGWALDWSPNGSVLATVTGQFGSLALFDAKTGNLIREIERPENLHPRALARDVEFSPDGTRLGAAWSYTNKAPGKRTSVAAVFSVNTGETLYDIELKSSEGTIDWFRWSPDGNRFAVPRTNQIHVHDSLDGAPLLSFRSSSRIGIQQDLKWNPDPEANEFVVKNCVGLMERYSLTEPLPQGSFNEHRPEFNTVRNGSGAALAWCSKGNLIAVANPNSYGVEVWEAKHERLLWDFRDFNEAALGVEFSPDSRYLAAGGAGGAIRIWDMKTGDRIGFIPLNIGFVRRIEWSPDGKQLAALTTRHLVVCPFVHTPQGSAEGQASDLSWRHDSSEVCFSGRKYLWQAAPGQQVEKVEIAETDFALNATYSPDGNWLAFWERADPGCRIWLKSLKADKVTELYRSDSNVASLSWSADGSHLALAAYSMRGKEFRVFRMDGKEEISHPGLSFKKGRWVPGTWCWGASPGEICAWRDGKLLRWTTPGSEEAEAVASIPAPKTIAMDPTGRWLAIASVIGRIDLRDTTSFELVRSIKSHVILEEIDWSPDGSRLAIRSRDGSVQLWDPETGDLALFLRLPNRRAATSIEWSPDGRYLAVGDNAGQVHFLDGEESSTN